MSRLWIYGVGWMGLLWAASAMAQSATEDNQSGATQWFRGNLHTHSFRSDGNDFPEMIVDWYKSNGYHFLALTDHNVLTEGERWMSRKQIDDRSRGRAFEKYLDRFGADWVVTRETVPAKGGDPVTEVQLKGMEEYRQLFESPGEFLLMPGEEITDSVGGRPVHMNATNLRELLSPMGGTTVREAIAANLRIARAQEQASGRPILVHLNHPNFGYAVTAEDLAFVMEERFFEVYNGHPAVGQNGKVNFPAVEEIWDIANTLRIGELNSPPLFGLGTDDSHNYHDSSDSISGRGWVMVRAKELTPEALIAAMRSGDFYASSGVTLTDVVYDASSGRIEIEIEPEEGVTFETCFIGTLAETDRHSEDPVDSEGKPIVATRRYSKDIGQVLKRQEGTTASFHLTGKELFVRAVITSSKPHPKPSFADQREQAWTQPVGWESRVR